jgi:hypothetical protein
MNTVQDVMIEDLYRQVVELTQRLTVQNMKCIVIAIQNPILKTGVTILFWFRNSVIEIKSLFINGFDMKKTFKILLNVL